MADITSRLRILAKNIIVPASALLLVVGLAGCGSTSGASSSNAGNGAANTGATSSEAAPTMSDPDNCANLTAQSDWSGCHLTEANLRAYLTTKGLINNRMSIEDYVNAFMDGSVKAGAYAIVDASDDNNGAAALNPPFYFQIGFSPKDKSTVAISCSDGFAKVGDNGWHGTISDGECLVDSDSGDYPNAVNFTTFTITKLTDLPERF